MKNLLKLSLASFLACVATTDIKAAEGKKPAARQTEETPNSITTARAALKPVGSRRQQTTEATGASTIDIAAITTPVAPQKQQPITQNPESSSTSIAEQQPSLSEEDLAYEAKSQKRRLEIEALKKEIAETRARTNQSMDRIEQTLKESKSITDSLRDEVASLRDTVRTITTPQKNSNTSSLDELYGWMRSTYYKFSPYTPAAANNHSIHTEDVD